jgi:hypothetical protein
MAYYFLFPQADTTLYSQPDRYELNTGNDEILELVKERGTTNNLLYPSRILIKFKNEEIQNLITDTINTGSTDIFSNGTSSVSLQLFSAEPKNLLNTLNVNVYAVSHSWDEGSGRWSNLPTSSNGASWRYRNNTTIKTEWATSSFGPGSGETGQTGTGSILNPLLTKGGGTWYTGSGFTSTQQFLSGDTLDTNFNVTDIVKKWSASICVSQTHPIGIINHGFLIKKPNGIENNTTSSFGELQYFSTDTHTIYPPKLCFKWDDSKYPHKYTASALWDTGNGLSVSLYNTKEEYNQNDIAQFRIHVREKYPTRQFVTSSNYVNVKYFTTSSYYSIRDAHTEEEIIPFDDTFTKLSADDKGMYFKLYMKGLQPERYYRVLFKNKSNNSTTIYDDNYYFKVIR